VVGRPGTGKTWILLHLAKAAWEAGKKVLFLTFEMAETVIGRRFDSLVIKLPYHNLRAGELGAFVEKRYKEEMEKLKGKGDMTIMSGGWASSPLQVEGVISTVKPDIIFIDGVYLMQDGMKTKEPWQRVQNVADQLKQMAMRIDIPVVGSAQLNRNVNIKKLRGGLESVGGSDRLVQNADIVMGLFRNDRLIEEKELLMRLMKVREDEMASLVLNWDFEKVDFTFKRDYKDYFSAKKEEVAKKSATPIDETAVDF